MIIDLHSFEGRSKEFDFDIFADEIDLDLEDARLRSDVKISGELIRQIAQTDVIGKIAAEIEVNCLRCLEPVADSVSVDYEVSYVTPENFGAEKEQPVDQADLATDVFSGDQIDLTEIAREQILLNLPQQVFCKPDCKGLCPQCGANRNLIDCNCDDNEVDPRWAALKNLK